MKPTIIYCLELKVYNDMGMRDSKFVDTGISNCECEAYMNGKQCINGGKCIVAREPDTWKYINKQSFGKKEKK